jgi:hypothetical protein
VSLVVWAVAAVALACLGVLAVMVVGLVRQLKALSGSMKAFQEALQPTLDAIQSEGDRAQRRMQRLPAGRAGLLELARDAGDRPGVAGTAG